MTNNRLKEILNIDVPIIHGGMGNISAPELAAAVTEAGGLGTIGAGTLPLDDVAGKISEMKKKVSSAWCVNIPITVHPDTKGLVDLVIKEKVPAVSLSAGNPAPLIPHFHEHGIKVICVTASVRQAQKAEAAGADVIVCEGYEAAGINSTLETTTFALVPQIVKAVKVPVAAAGGIADGRGLAAALTLGAEGVQMGTRLIATREAPYHEKYKQAIRMAGDKETVILGRRFGQRRRVLKNNYAKRLAALEEADEYKTMTSEERHIRGAVEGDFDEGFINSGQIAGLIDDLPGVKELFDRMIKDAQRHLEQSMRLL